MKTLLGILTLFYFGKFSGNPMNMEAYRPFVIPRPLVRMRMIKGSRKDESLGAQLFGWVDHVYLTKGNQIDPLSFETIVTTNLVHSAERFPMEKFRSTRRGTPLGNQSDHPFARFFR